MLKKTINLFLCYVLMATGFLLFFTSCGYAIFVVDWHVSGVRIAVNAVLLLLAIAASICIYGLAEKIRLNN